jgi:carbon-monoxide dehydrogenase small subunit
MIPVTIDVNAQQVNASVEPRTSLADFLREQCRLTGTHLGCEHGVCGACTVLIDDQPARACITLAATCDGLAVRTIEGFEDDAVMGRLRKAFSEEHALQCGFCTPGMLISARDIVRRARSADEGAIRIDLSGNLCRCTGYLGIVNAVRKVIETSLRATAAEPLPAVAAPLQAFVPKEADVTLAPRADVALGEGPETRKGWARFEESFIIRRPPAEVWRIFADVPLVAACLPGVTLTEHTERSAKGTMSVKLGPIVAAFGGSAVIERNDAEMCGVIRGAGNDKGTRSRTKGDVSYRLVPMDDGAGTKVDIAVEYNLQGALAQFSRSSLADELGRRLVADFAINLNSRLMGSGDSVSAAANVNAGRMVWALIWNRVRQLFGGTGSDPDRR